jgi:hypothetical protein
MNSERNTIGRAGSPLHADRLNQKFDSQSSLNTRNKAFSRNPELNTETLWPTL